MKGFLKHIGMILLIITTLMILFDVSYSYVFKVSEPRSKIQKILQLSDTHYDYIFLGSSRTENHIDCEVIKEVTGKSCINFGISGGSIGDMAVLLRLIEANNVTFEKVFLQLDYNYNASGLSQNFKARLMPFINEPTVREELTLVGLDKTEKYIPFYRFMKNDQVVGFRELVSSIINKTPKTDINVKFAPKKGIGLEVATSFPEVIHNSNSEVAAIANLVASKDKVLQFFTAPYCPEVKGRELAIKELKRRVKGLWDYSNLYDEQLDYFFNCGHLNIMGARDFSRIIAQRELQNQD